MKRSLISCLQVVAVTSLDSLTDPLKKEWVGKMREGGSKSLCVFAGQPLLLLLTKTNTFFICACWSSLELSYVCKSWLPVCICVSIFFFMQVCMRWAAAEWGSVLKHHPVYSTHVTSVSHSASLGRQLWLVSQNKCCWNWEHIDVNTRHDVASWQSALRLRLVEINQMWSSFESK